MRTTRSDFSTATPLQHGSSPLIESIETNFASLVSSLKELDAVRKRSQVSADGPEKLALACDQFCTSSKRVMRATIQSVDKMVEEYSVMKHIKPENGEIPVLVDRSNRPVPATSEYSSNLTREGRDLILSQKVLDYWKMYCFGQKVKRAVEKRQSEMLTHLQSAQKLAEGAKAEVTQVEQKEASLKAELQKSRLESQALMKQVQELNSTIYKLETDGGIKQASRSSTPSKPDLKVLQVQSDLKLLNEQLKQSDQSAKELAEELRTLRLEHVAERQVFEEDLARLNREKGELQEDLKRAMNASSGSREQQEMQIKALTATLSERDRIVAQLESQEKLHSSVENEKNSEIQSLKRSLLDRDQKINELEKLVKSRHNSVSGPIERETQNPTSDVPAASNLGVSLEDKENQIRLLTAELQDRNDRLALLEEAVSKKATDSSLEISRVKDRVASLELIIEEKQKEINELRNMTSQKPIANTFEANESLNTLLVERDRRIAELEESLSRPNASLARAEAQVQSLEALLDAKENRISDLEAEIVRAGKEKVVSAQATQGLQSRLEMEIKSLKQANEDLLRSLDASAQRVSSLEMELTEKHSSLARAKEQNRGITIQSSEEDYNDQLDSLRATLMEKSKRVSDLETENLHLSLTAKSAANLESQLSSLRSALDQRDQRISELEDENLKSRSNSRVDALMKALEERDARILSLEAVGGKGVLEQQIVLDNNFARVKEILMDAGMMTEAMSVASEAVQAGSMNQKQASIQTGFETRDMGSDPHGGGQKVSNEHVQTTGDDYDKIVRAVERLRDEVAEKQEEEIRLRKEISDLRMRLNSRVPEPERIEGDGEVQKGKSEVERLRNELAEKHDDVTRLKKEVLELRMQMRNGHMEAQDKQEGGKSKSEVERLSLLVSDWRKKAEETAGLLEQLKRIHDKSQTELEQRLKQLSSELEERTNMVHELQFRLGMSPRIVGSVFKPLEPVHVGGNISVNQLREWNSVLLEKMINMSEIVDSEVLRAQQEALQLTRRELAECESTLSTKEVEVSKLTGSLRLAKQQLEAFEASAAETKQELGAAKAELIEVVKDAKRMQDRYEDRLKELSVQIRVSEMSVKDEKEIESTLVKQNKELQARIDLLDRDLNDAENEIEDLTSQLETRESIEVELRSRIEEVETAYESIMRSLNGVSAAEGVARMEAELKSLRAQLADAERAIQGLASELADADKTTLGMQNLLAAAETDLERLVGELQSSESEKQTLRNQLMAIKEGELNSVVEDSLRASLSAVRGEVEQLRRDVRDREESLKMYRDSTDGALSLKEEIDRLTISLKETEDRELQLRTKCDSLTAEVEKADELRTKCASLSKEIEALEKASHKVESELRTQCDSLARKIDAAHQVESELRTQCQSLHEEVIMLRQSQGTANELQSKCKVLTQEIAQVRTALSASQSREKEVTTKCGSLILEIQDLKDKLFEAEGWKRELEQSGVELKNVQSKLTNVVNELKKTENERNDMHSLLESSDRKIKVLKEQLQEKESELEEFVRLQGSMEDEDKESQTRELQREIDRLHKVLNAKDQPAEDAQREIEKLQSVLEEKDRDVGKLQEDLRLLQRKYNEQMEELDEADRETVRLENLVGEKDRVIAEWRSREEDLKNSLNQSIHELEEVNKRRSERALAQQVGKFEVFAMSTKGEEQLVSVLQASLRQAETRQAELVDERMKLEAQVLQLRASNNGNTGNEELLATINKLVDEKSSLTNRLARLEELLDGKQRGKVHSLQQVIRDIVAQAKPALVLQPLSEHVVTEAGGSVVRYAGLNKDADMCGCAITNAPLPVFEEGLYFEVRITKTQQGNPDGLTVGVTTTPPWQGEPIPNTLDDIPNSWAVGYNGQSWNGSKGEWRQIDWCGKDLVEGQRVGVFIAAPPVSQLFVFLDDILVAKGPSRIPSCFDHAFYGLVDMLGNCDSVTLLWGAKPPAAAQDLLAIDPRRENGLFRLPLRRGALSDESSIMEETSSPMRKVAVPRLPLKPTVEPSGPLRPPSESDVESFRAAASSGFS
jgi:chromosome segregation ATPase